jgi:hypothetical protein
MGDGSVPGTIEVKPITSGLGTVIGERGQPISD